MLRACALELVDSLGIEGNCSVRFAVRPDGGEYAVLEADPCISRTSALFLRQRAILLHRWPPKSRSAIRWMRSRTLSQAAPLPAVSRQSIIVL